MSPQKTPNKSNQSKEDLILEKLAKEDSNTLDSVVGPIDVVINRKCPQGALFSNKIMMDQPEELKLKFEPVGFAQDESRCNMDLTAKGHENLNELKQTFESMGRTQLTGLIKIDQGLCASD